MFQNSIRYIFKIFKFFTVYLRGFKLWGVESLSCKTLLLPQSVREVIKTNGTFHYFKLLETLLHSLCVFFSKTFFNQNVIYFLSSFL